jgi:hypothetical protein
LIFDKILPNKDELENYKNKLREAKKEFYSTLQQDFNDVYS